MTLRNKKIICGVCLFAGIFFLPWYVFIALAFLSVVFLPHFWFAIILALLIDAVYSVPFAQNTHFFYGRFGVWTGALFVIYLIIESLRKQIRMGN